MNPIAHIWGKTCSEDSGRYHPLILHMLDVAACVSAILEREPESTRNRIAGILGLPWPDAQPWLLVLVACHDLGKASPGFQLKWEPAKKILREAGFRLPRLPDTAIHHAFVTQMALEPLLANAGWPAELAELCAEAMGAHHGTRATAVQIDRLRGNRDGVDERNWGPVRATLFDQIRGVFQPRTLPGKSTLSGPDYMLLAGLASYADWIGSNEDWFPIGSAENCDDLHAWYVRSSRKAQRALDAIGWNARTPLLIKRQDFPVIFPKCTPPRDLQTKMACLSAEVVESCVLLVEAPMGEGKTEAALFAHLELQRRFGHRGLYMALPSKATGNAMFRRVLAFLDGFAGARHLDLQLLHGGAQLNDEFQKMRISRIDDDESNGAVRAGGWFTNKKRALLSEYGVGTVDQALLTILPVRHYFVRLWGLANRVVVFDEIHAYDAYTSTLLMHLIRWLRALGSSVILLSATLPPEFRRQLATRLGTSLPQPDAPYPRITVFERHQCRQVELKSDESRKRTLSIVPLDASLDSIRRHLQDSLPRVGTAAVIVNTVQRAQDLYVLMGDGAVLQSGGIIVGKRLADGTEVHLFHARFPADLRQTREDAVLSFYGKNDQPDGKPGSRTGRRILIATQVVEQSLDLDFDLMVTDLAPIDLILQRAGRLWRHERGARCLDRPLLCIAGLSGETPVSFGDPLWWNAVYEREDLLLRTWQELKGRTGIIIPDEIDSLVGSVYDGLEIPSDSEIAERLARAELDGEGNRTAQQTMAHQAIVGLPDDASWKDTNRLYLFDEDDPAAHPTVRAQTRLGDDSVVAIPLSMTDGFVPGKEPEFKQAKEWAMRAVSLSRKSVVARLRKLGIPEGWKKSPLLRNCFSLQLNDDGTWIEDPMVRLDDALGIVYTPREVR